MKIPLKLQNLMIRSFFFHFLILAAFVYSTFVGAENIHLEEYDISRYPKVELKLRAGKGVSLDQEILTVSEQKENRSRRVGPLKIHRPEGTRPVHIYLITQMTNSFDHNVQATEILKTIVERADSADRFSFVFFTDDVFFSKDDLSKSDALKEAKVPGGKSNRNTSANLDYVFQKISSRLKDTDYILTIFYDQDFIPSNEAQNGEYTPNIPINVLSFPSNGGKFLPKRYGGTFYSLNSPDFRTQVFGDLDYFRKEPWSLVYESPFQDEWQFQGSGNLEVELETKNSRRLSFSYDLPFRTRLAVFLLHPSIFLPSFTFLLVLTLVALIVVLKKGKKQNPEGTVSPEERLHTIEFEQDAYRKMYGNQYQLVYSEEDRIETERAAPVALKEFEQGESYEKATLVFKEGRNPGKQYSLARAETNIGNSDLCDLVLYEQSVSKNHARIRKVRNRYVLYDLVSESGTFLNGKKILRPRILYDFDEIGIGKALLVFRGK
ncbi:FHA domain-containing protein [Leptospira andrefontaineae]|uniref:FHA domain-containing protein n=1 Tax=Leptospira andrefontaineae TaxID=2484976 RepID=A0A4R9H2N0_9LEPT|nr:FHA domain-containing protein [Leptospira andrefontaineae]TGK38926.1 FHA domain-containing protein [Leptospira andrefontaineae]